MKFRLYRDRGVHENIRFLSNCASCADQFKVLTPPPPLRATHRHLTVVQAWGPDKECKMEVLSPFGGIQMLYP